MKLNHVTVQAHDFPRSAAFYRALGLLPIVDSGPRYARFLCPHGGSSLAVTSRPTAATVHFECDDLDATVAGLAARGIVPETAPADQPWLWREARLRDPDGNPIVLYTAGKNRLNPPWRQKEVW
ncbi:MAG: VOC family protein [Kiloniellales bacterium]|nr:VOC family protein [Kiloniellales bacterium]